MLRIALLALLAALAASCASVPVDPNLAALAASHERIEAQRLAHAEAQADAQSRAAVACANASEPAVCALGQVAMTLAANAGNAARSTDSPLSRYRPPPTRMQQFAQFTAAVGGVLGPLASGYVTVETNREANATSRAIAELNAGREMGIVQAIAGLGSDIAGAPPALYVGGDYVGRDRADTRTETSAGGNLGDTQTIGRDMIGRDRVDNSGIIGDQNNTRVGSPGPITDDHSDPGDCDNGGDCSTDDNSTDGGSP